MHTRLHPLRANDSGQRIRGVAMDVALRNGGFGPSHRANFARTFRFNSFSEVSGLLFVGLYTFTLFIFLTAHMAGKWLPACQPEPNRAIVLASSRARQRAAMALLEATRMRCTTPSGKIASGSPFSVENNITKPTYLSPGAAGTLVFTTLPPCCRQRMMSELMRIATMGGSTSPASIDLKA